MIAELAAEELVITGSVEREEQLTGHRLARWNAVAGRSRTSVRRSSDYAKPMKRFDAARGKLVANASLIEQRPLGHDESEVSGKNQLH
jgi:hypothetical protein